MPYSQVCIIFMPNVSCSDFITAPTAPRNLMVVAVTAFNVTIQWEEPDPTNGIITNYIIQYYQESSPNTVNDSVQGTSVVVDGLRAFTTYVFRVSAETVAEGPYTETDPTRTAESSMSACTVLSLRVEPDISIGGIPLSVRNASLVCLCKFNETLKEPRHFN